MNIRLAESDMDIARCFAVMRQLRPNLADEAAFVARARRQMEQDRWRLAYARNEDDAVMACCGFRILECLATGRTLYVDDLVTDTIHRSEGFGENLLRWVEERARAEGCETLSLDSGTARQGAHRFYFRMGLPITSFHFARKL